MNQQGTLKFVGQEHNFYASENCLRKSNQRRVVKFSKEFYEVISDVDEGTIMIQDDRKKYLRLLKC